MECAEIQAVTHRLGSLTRGVKRDNEAPREVYIRDEAWKTAYREVSRELQVTMDIANLPGQRPADVRKMRRLEMSDHSFLLADQDKTAQKLLIRLHTEGLRTVLRRLSFRAVLNPAVLGPPRGQAADRQHFEPAR